MTTTNNQNNQKKKKKQWVIAALALLLLLIVGIILYFLFHKEPVLPPELTPPPVPAQIKKGHRKPPDTVLVVAPLRDTVVKKKPPVKAVKRKPDTIPVPRDTLPHDTVASIPVPVYVRCQDDTVPPYVYPNPSGGLHYGTIFVRFVVSEPCSIEWRFGGEKIWHSWANDSIEINHSIVLSYRAKDTCGNTMPLHTERYEISSPLKKKYCPADMEYVKVEKAQFCIDRYEWPNRLKTRPQSNISVYQAMDSCFTIGKRLCTTDEWSLACGGVYNWKYPYGDTYESHACVTKDTASQESGAKPECRGYFNVYDMSGNLSEWTDTRSKVNSYFYNVMGGFWESGPQSSCFEPRYSYYPQNKHNPVGFRCCRDINKE